MDKMITDKMTIDLNVFSLTMRDRIITPIPLLSFIIAKKTTKP